MTDTAFDRDDFLEELWHRTQIHDVLLRYFRGLDRMDFDLVRDAFHPDAIDSHGPYEGDVEGWVEWLSSRHGMVEQCMHVIANCLIERDGDVAAVETYSICYQRTAADGTAARAIYSSGEQDETSLTEQVVSIGRYLDRFERRESGWKIAHRTAVFEAHQTYSAQMEFPPAGWHRALRGPEDIMWQVRREALGSRA